LQLHCTVRYILFFFLFLNTFKKGNFSLQQNVLEHRLNELRGRAIQVLLFHALNYGSQSVKSKSFPVCCKSIVGSMSYEINQSQIWHRTTEINAWVLRVSLPIQSYSLTMLQISKCFTACTMTNKNIMITKL
jgi:hypothetical protein